LEKAVQARFKVRVYRKVAAFTWLSTCDLKAEVDVDELARVARKMGLKVDGATIRVEDLDAYNRLLLYAAVRPYLRHASQANELLWLVRNMNSWEAGYWASAFREAWWARPNAKSVRRVAKAFITLFELAPP